MSQQTGSSEGRSFDSFGSARLELDIESTSGAVDEAISLVVNLLTKFNSRAELKGVILAVDEAMRNAYEHGNLGITSEEKAELAASGNLEATLREKEEVARKRNLRIRISAAIENGVFTCEIADDGNGFDWKGKLKQLESSELDPTASSGRGVSLIQKFLDVVRYNDAGNILTIEQKISAD